MAESLLFNHALVDRKESVTFIASDVSLHLNGYELAVPTDAGEEFIVGTFEAKDCSFVSILPCIREHIVAV